MKAARQKGEGNLRVLVVNTAFVGDVVLTTPLLRALRERFNDGFIVFLGTPGTVELISALPFVDKFMTYDKREAERGINGLRKKAAELRELGFDAAVSTHRSARTALLLKMAGIPERIGFATSVFPWLYTHRAPRDPDKHEVLRNLELMVPLSGPPEGFEPGLCLPEMEPAKQDLLGDGAGKLRVGLFPGSIWNTKRWLPEGFARVGDRLREERDAAVYVLGMEQDREAASEVGAYSRGPVINMSGKVGRKDLNRLLFSMHLVITNDSAPAHIASALQVPAVVVFGPTSSSQGFSPWQRRNKVVENNELACRPCSLHGAKRCPEGHFKCMETVTPEQVVKAANELLGKRF